MSEKNQSRIANSVDPNETTHYEPSHQDLHCLHRYLVWSTGLKGERVKAFKAGKSSVKNDSCLARLKTSIIKTNIAHVVDCY